MALQILLSAAIVIVTVAILLEVRAWSRGTRMVTKWQKRYRIAAAAMMNAVLLMVIFGPTVHARTTPLFELGYWGVTTILSFTLVAIAMLDVRAALISYRERRREMFTGVFGDERQDK